jgi:hypothetical protein
MEGMGLEIQAFPEAGGRIRASILSYDATGAMGDFRGFFKKF